MIDTARKLSNLKTKLIEHSSNLINSGSTRSTRSIVDSQRPISIAAILSLINPPPLIHPTKINILQIIDDTKVGYLEIGRASCRERGWIWRGEVYIREKDRKKMADARKTQGEARAVRR